MQKKATRYQSGKVVVDDVMLGAQVRVAESFVVPTMLARRKSQKGIVDDKQQDWSEIGAKPSCAVSLSSKRCTESCCRW